MRKKRRQVVLVYVTETEKKAIARVADAEGLSESSYARQLLLSRVNGVIVQTAAQHEPTTQVTG